jgi:hypothetical protein
VTAAAPLTPAIKSMVAHLFHGLDRDLVESILLNDCVHYEKTWTPEKHERVRAAILRLSDGSLDSFEAAVGAANSDWRDVLVAAGFADDIRLHQRWLRGEAVPGF